MVGHRRRWGLVLCSTAQTSLSWTEPTLDPTLGGAASPGGGLGGAQEKVGVGIVCSTAQASLGWAGLN